MKNFKERLSKYANGLIPKAVKLADELNATFKPKKTNLENELDEKMNSDYVRFCSNALHNKFEVDVNAPDVCGYIKTYALADSDSVLELRLCCEKSSTCLMYTFQASIDDRVQLLTQHGDYSLIVNQINKFMHFEDEYHCEESASVLDDLKLPTEQFTEFLKERGKRISQQILDNRKQAAIKNELRDEFIKIVKCYGFKEFGLSMPGWLLAKKDVDSDSLTIGFNLETKLFSFSTVQQFSDSKKHASGFSHIGRLDDNLELSDFKSRVEKYFPKALKFDAISFLTEHDFSLKSNCSRTYSYKNLNGYNLLINPTNAQLNGIITFDLTFENFCKFHEALSNINDQTELLKSLGKQK